MSKITLLLFWVIWLLDVLLALYGYREFLHGLFGRNAAPTSKYIAIWVILLGAALFIIGGSVYFKNQGAPIQAITVAAIPLVLASPYVLWIVAVLLAGKRIDWR